MKVVHFISHFPYQDQRTNTARADGYVCSGGEWAAYHLVLELAKAGHKVEIVTSSHGREDEREQQEGFSVYRYSSWCKVGETLFAPGMFYRPPRDMEKPDIVHIHHTTPPGGMAGLTCNRVWKCPLVVTHHGFEKPDSYGDIIRRAAVFLSAKYYVEKLFTAATRIIYISPAYFKSSRFLGKHTQKARVIPHGMNLAEFNTDIPMAQAQRELELAPDRRYGLFVGTLIPPKGLGVLLQAIPEVVRSHPEFNLLIIGRGPKQREFHNQARDLGISDNVHFEGFIGETRKKLLFYRASDVLIIPSFLSEMYCFVLYEGAAAGCCMVTSDLEVFKKVINDHVNGILTAAGNSSEIGKAILEVLQKRDLQEQLMHGAHSQITPPTWPQIGTQTEELYLSLLQEEQHLTGGE